MSGYADCCPTGSHTQPIFHADACNIERNRRAAAHLDHPPINVANAG